MNKELIKNFPKYYRETINTWGSKFSCQALLSSATLSQFLWFSSQIQIGNRNVFVSSFSGQNIDFVGKLFKNRKCSKIMGTNSRRVWSSKYTEVEVDSTNSFFTKTMDIY